MTLQTINQCDWEGRLSSRRGNVLATASAVVWFCAAGLSAYAPAVQGAPSDAQPSGNEAVRQAVLSPVVTVRQGRLQGRQAADGLSVFQGVPFAAPPVGALRWRPPRPAYAWEGVRSAVKYGPACAQHGAGFGTMFDKIQNEDCLYLNIWSPDLKPRHPLPVMLYFHGGGFVGGAGSIPTFDGVALGKKGVITVTVNYRLGVFGFFAHPELTAESPHKASGNYGLADQQAALRWVKDNIAAFGGDPARVSIFGQSAGSVSVMDLMASPLSRGLFEGAIAESGTPLLGGSLSLAEAQQQGSAFAAAQGGASIAQLRALPAEDLMKRWAAFGGAAIGRSWPIADGWILPEPPAKIFEEHHELAVPLITGSNAREALSVPGDAELAGRLRNTFGEAADRAAALYSSGGAPDPVLGSSGNMFATDITFRCPAVTIETWHAVKGAPVYAYHFEEALPGRQAMGSQHSDEVSFVFGTLGMLSFGRQPPEAAAKLSETMVTYWANFAKRGDPNGPGVPQWPRFTPMDKAFVHLSSAGVRADGNLRREACDLYREAAMPRQISRNALP